MPEDTNETNEEKIDDLEKPFPPDIHEPKSLQEIKQNVQFLLQKMQDIFQIMSDQIINRVDELGIRVDELKKKITILMAQASVEDEIM